MALLSLGRGGRRYGLRGLGLLPLPSEDAVTNFSELFGDRCNPPRFSCVMAPCPQIPIPDDCPNYVPVSIPKTCFIRGVRGDSTQFGCRPIPGVAYPPTTGLDLLLLKAQAALSAQMPQPMTPLFPTPDPIVIQSTSDGKSVARIALALAVAYGAYKLMKKRG